MDGFKSTTRGKNPRENANSLSVATFFYTIPTFLQGFKKEFEEQDLYETYSGHKSSKLGEKIERLWFKELNRSNTLSQRPSLQRVLFQCFGCEHFMYGFISLFSEIFVKTFQIIALGELITFYGNITEESNKNDAFIYAMKIILSSFVALLIGHPTSAYSYHLGIKMRVALSSLIYRKAMKLSNSAFEKTTTGQIINFISNDLKNCDKFSQMLPYVWVGPIQTIFLSYFMYQEAGYCCIFGVAFLLCFIPLHFYMAKFLSRFRTRSASRTDERIRLMNEIILGVQVIKMYTWEKPFAKLIALYRKLEMKAIRKSAHMVGMYSIFTNLNSRFALFLTLVSYVLVNNKINAHQVFVLSGLYNLLRQTMVVFFSSGVSLTAEMKVCLKRITDFLLLEEAKSYDEDKVEQTDAITLKNVSAKWSTKSERILNNINLNIYGGSLTAIIGLVGSGKSTLLNTILKEIPVLDGDVCIKGKISYSSQEPWLYHESVQQNILFGTDFDRLRYNKVIKACALVNDFRRLPHSDLTIVGDKGTSLSGGQKARVNLARAIYREADIYLLDDPLSAVDTRVGKEIFEQCIKSYLKEKTVVLVTHQLQYLKDVDNIVLLENGLVIAQGTPTNLQQSGIEFTKFLRRDSLEEKKGEEEETTSENERRRKDSADSSNSSDLNIQTPVLVREQQAAGSISSSIYKEYIKAGANWCIFAIILLLFVGLQTLISGCDYFLAYWVNIEQTEAEQKNVEPNGFRQIFLIIYSIIIVLIIAVSVARSIVFIETCIKASINLHDRMFENIIRAVLRFFSVNPSGRILNRFSKDMGIIDEIIPGNILDSTTVGLWVIGVVFVISIVNPWLIIPLGIITVVFYLLRIIYIGTSRSIKRLEGVTKSPVIAHLNASLQGLTTIRASQAQSLLIKEFDSHQDLNTCAYFLFFSTSKAFGYWLDLCCLVYVIIVTLSCLFSENEKFGGNVGLIISQALMLTRYFQWVMRQITELENQMTSVERVLEYNDIETEQLDTTSQPISDNWPQRGKIEFLGVSLKYFQNAEPILKSVTFKIEPLQKIGIVGRTGAGKSSLISALFRLTDIDGTILIDDIDIKNISLRQLRSKISIIPQEPILFSGSMRKNLDPFDEFSDDLIWKALEKVELKNCISDLSSEVSEGGSNLSVGQRQLVCLARALLRNNKILILDEATANVDYVTDALIQKTIRKEFDDCTVLTIAHRLETIIDCDKILVMDDGEVAEFDRPPILLENINGIFYSMLQKMGSTIVKKNS